MFVAVESETGACILIPIPIPHSMRSLNPPKHDG
jgi:hypothetical protein